MRVGYFDLSFKIITQGIPRRTFHQGVERGALMFAHDEIVVPVAGNGFAIVMDFAIDAARHAPQPPWYG